MARKGIYNNRVSDEFVELLNTLRAQSSNGKVRVRRKPECFPEDDGTVYEIPCEDAAEKILWASFELVPD